MTPLPSEYWNNFSTRLQVDVGFDYYFGFPGKVDLPMVLTRFYGATLYPRLKFVVTMREPLAQLQSGYWFMCCLEKVIFKGLEIFEISSRQFEKELRYYVKNSLKVPEISMLMYAK